MIYIYQYGAGFMFLVVMVYLILSSSMSSLVIFNFPLVFKISLLFVETCVIHNITSRILNTVVFRNHHFSLIFIHFS